MDRLTHDDGSFRLNETKREVMSILEYFDDRSNLSEEQVEFTEVIRHTFGEPIMDSTRAPFDEWTETVIGSVERINALGSRLNELSEQVAEQDETYAQVYQETAEFVFDQFENAEEF